MACNVVATSYLFLGLVGWFLLLVSGLDGHEASLPITHLYTHITHTTQNAFLV